MGFYMEACESGSMFPGLPTDSKIFAVTAANAKESSWGYYCSGSTTGGDVMNGKHMGTCLGDLFSISWMEDSDLGTKTETIKTQVERVSSRTNKSHVTTFGDTSFENEPFNNFESNLRSDQASFISGSLQDAMDVRDIPLRLAYHRWEAATFEAEKTAAFKRLQEVVTARQGDVDVFDKIARKVCNGCSHHLMNERQDLTDLQCHKELVNEVQVTCPRRSDRNVGGWNGFNMKYSQLLVNICERRVELGHDVESLRKIVHKECSDGIAATRAEIVV